MVAEVDVVELERLALNAWPALNSFAFGNWVFRTGGGYTKRANSANAVARRSLTSAVKSTKPTQNIDFREVMVEAERYYAANGQTTIFRLTPLAGSEADALLAEAGYEFLELSHVMVASLEAARMTKGVRIDLDVGMAWLEKTAAAQAITPDYRPIHDRIIKSIAPPKAFATAYLAKDPVGFGLAVVENGAVGLFDIVVRADSRGHGLGRELMNALLAWGKAQGAEVAYLQVTAANHTATRLYKTLGFRTAYEYHYRRRAF